MLEPGESLSHYRIVEKIGSGGMGVVYLARNLQLDSDVALKVLRSGALEDPGSRRRFRREARALSRLVHPNIAVVHDFDTQDGVDFIVMEFVPGKTLAERLAAAPMREKEILRLGMQLAAGVEAAHQQGVIHCDLKPANMRLTPDGVLKILDFGLARLLRPRSDDSTTDSLSGNTIGGTPAYMAPEQLDGADADARTDIHAVGAILYEMATRKRAFPQTETLRLLNAILREAPVAPRLLNHEISSDLEHIIAKALDKDPGRRYQSARELHIDLERLATPSVPAAPPPRPIPRLPIAVAILAALAVLAITLRPPREPRDFQGTPTLVPLITWPGKETAGRLSPDGQWIAFAARRSEQSGLWLRKLDGGEPRPVILPSGNVTSHAWSPDGRQIAFLLVQDEQLFLQFVSPSGGPVLRSVRLDSLLFHATLVRWRSGIYLEQPRSGLWCFDPGTERVRLVLASQTSDGRRSEFDVSENEKRVAYVTWHEGRASLWHSDLDGREPARLTHGAMNEWQPCLVGHDGRTVVFCSDRSGQTDLWRLSLSNGSRKQITFSIDAETVDDVSADGSVITFRRNQDRAHLWVLDPRHAEPRAWQLGPQGMQDSWPSADRAGRRIVFQRKDAAISRVADPFASQILMADLAGPDLHSTRTIAEEGGIARLSSDGEWVAFARAAGGRFELWVQSVATEHRWRVTEHFEVPPMYPFPMDWVTRRFTWSPAAAELFFVDHDTTETKAILRSRPAGNDPGPETIVQAAGGEQFSDLEVSKDGRFLGYVAEFDSNSVERSELRSHDLLSGEERVLLVDRRTRRGGLLSRGWLPGDSSLLVLRTAVNPDWTERSEILRVSRSGSSATLGIADRVFAGTSRLDPERGLLAFTQVEEDGTHDLHAFELARSRWIPLTHNKDAGVSFAGLEWLADGRLLYSQQERDEDIWCIRFDPRHRGGMTP